MLRARCKVRHSTNIHKIALAALLVSAVCVGGGSFAQAQEPQGEDAFALSLEEFLNEPSKDAAPSAEGAGEVTAEEPAMTGQEMPSGAIGSEAGDDTGAGMFDDAFGMPPAEAESQFESESAPESFDADGESFPAAAGDQQNDARQDTEAQPDAASDLNIFEDAADEKPNAAPQKSEKIILDFNSGKKPKLNVPARATVTLRGLDKITARISEHKVKVGQAYRFGTLNIVMRTCAKAPPEETPEVTAFLEIAEQREDEEQKELFRGWMYASNPAMSALEHPVYDVWVIDCNIVSGLAE